MATTHDELRPTAPAARPHLGKISAVVNPAAGGVRPGDDEVLEGLVAEHGYRLDLAVVEDRDCEAAVRRALDADPDLVLILAGDGTARLAAELAGPKGPLVAPLPGGTLNMLPKAIYGDLGWREALDAALQEGCERPVAGGTVDGRAFYVAAMLGPPALWGLAREAVRKGDWRETRRRVAYAWRRAFSGALRYGTGAVSHPATEALALITPSVSRATQDAAALEAVALDLHDAREILRLAFHGLVGEWRNDPAVSTELVTRGWAAMRRGIPAILDGETHRLPPRVDFAFAPVAFRALAAAIQPAPSL